MAKEDLKVKPEQRKEYRAQRRSFEGQDQLQGQLTGVPGVSERGVEARRGDLKVPADKVISHGYARVHSDPTKHLNRAKAYFKAVHAKIAAQPKPNLGKEEENPNKTITIWHPEKLEGGSIIDHNGKKYKVAHQDREPKSSAKYKTRYYTRIYEHKPDMSKMEPNAWDKKDRDKQFMHTLSHPGPWDADHMAKVKHIHDELHGSSQKRDLSFAERKLLSRARDILSGEHGPARQVGHLKVIKSETSLEKSWKFNPQTKQLNHPLHGSIAIKPHKGGGMAIVHNGAQVGVYSDQHKLREGLHNYTNSLPTNKPVTRMLNVPSNSRTVKDESRGYGSPPAPGGTQSGTGPTLGSIINFPGADQTAPIKKTEEYFQSALQKARKGKPNL
jgi:hypothetical protein